MIREKKQEFVLAVEITANYLQLGLFDYFGKNFAFSKVELYPEISNNGIIESNPNDWLAALKSAMRMIFARYYFRAEDLESIVVTGDWGILVPVDKEGKAVRNAIVSAEGKSNFFIKEILKDKISFSDFDVFKYKNWSKLVGSTPGNESQDAFSNLMYFKNRFTSIYNQTDKFLEAKDFLALKLGADAINTSDSAHSNHLIDLDANEYLQKIIDYSKLDYNKLPKIEQEATVIGELNSGAAEELGLISGVKIISCPSSIHTNLLGSATISQGKSFLFLGQDAWISQALGKKRISSKDISITRIAENKFAHSNRFAALSSISFFKKNFNSSAVEAQSDFQQQFYDLAENAKLGAKKLFFVPFYAQKALRNETFSGFYRTQYQHSQLDFARAIIEGVGFYARLKFEGIQKFVEESNILTISGLGAESEFWCQLNADIFGRNINCLEDASLVTLRGASFFASIEKKMLYYDDIDSLVKVSKIYEPNAKVSEKYAYIFEQYKQLF